MHYWSIDFFHIPLRTLFLACFVAVYLAMFEGWFLLRKECNIKIEQWVKNIVTLMPMFVLLLFPFQKFQLIYYVFFLFGHLIAWLYWEYNVLSKRKNSTQISIVRGLLGTITLVILILDKKYSLDVKDFIKEFINVNMLLEINTALVIIEVAICLLTAIIPILNKKEIVIKEDFRIILYVFIVLFLVIFYPAIIDIEAERVFLSIVGCLFFILFEAILILKRNNMKEKVNGDEKSQ